MAEIERYMPRSEKQWNRREDGSIKACIYTESGVVEVFTFPGDGRHEPFTTLAMWIWPHVYHQRFSRHYHERWLRRLATDFAHKCTQMTGSD